MRSRILRGFVFAGLFGTAAFFARWSVIELAPPRILDVFLIGIGLTSYFFSWVPALALLAASLVITHYTFPVSLFPFHPENTLDAVRLLLYAFVAVAAMAAIHRLKRAVHFWRATEEACRAVFKEASDGIAVFGPGLEVLEVNSSLREILDRSCQSTDARQLVEPEAPAERLRFQQALAGGKTVTLERCISGAGGRGVVIEVTARRLRDGRLVVIARDVSERTRTDQALREREALTRAVLYSAVDGIITTDEGGVVQSFNPAAEKLFGYAAAEVVGKPVSILMPAESRREGQSLEEYLRTAVKGVSEAVAQRQDGAIFPIELSVSEILLPGRRMYTGIVRDISQRKAAEEALRLAGEKLEAVIRTSPLAILTLDLDGNVKSWSRAAERIFGWTEQELLDRPLPIVPPDEKPLWRENLEAVRRGETLSGAERRRVRKDGTVVDVGVWSAVLRGRDGEINGVLGVLADISEQKRLEEQLVQAEKMEAIGRLAGGVAHDFNNMLTVITGYGELLRNALDASSPLRADVEEILKSAEHAAALTDQLLVFSRRQVVNTQLVDLNQVLAKLDRMLRRIIGEDVVLTIIPGEGIGSIRADPAQIEQVVVNLAANARDAMPGGGRLTIETAEVGLDAAYAQTHVGVAPGDYVMLSVSDTGRGIPPEVRPHLFEPFFTTKAKGKGTGLGLSTVYGVVKQCGGHIRVLSEPGRGTTFGVYLPRCCQPGEPCLPAGCGSAARSGLETVLLVEDEQAVRKLIRQILLQKGYIVLEAGDPRQALQICSERAGAIDLLLTDVVMPHMSGRELADRAVAVRPALKVLYISGYTDTVVMHHGITALGLAFLQKPFTPARLVEKVRQVLDGPS